MISSSEQRPCSCIACCARIDWNLVEQDDVATALAEFTELWKKGELDSARNKPGNVLNSLIPADMPVAKLPGQLIIYFQLDLCMPCLALIEGVIKICCR